MNQTLNAWLYARGDSVVFCKAIEMLVKGVLYKKSWKNMVNNITSIFKENYHYSFNVPLNRFWTSVCYYFIFLAFLMTAILTQVGIHNRLDLPRNGVLFPKLLDYCEKKYSSVPNLLNSQYFWKWTNANPMKIFGQLASHSKLLIGSKLSLG